MRPFMLATVALITACSAQPAANNQAAAPAPSPALNAAGNVTTGDEAAGLVAFRAQWLEACVGGARDAAPPGTPVERHCGCAIERMMAGKTLAELEADQASGAYRAPFQAEMRRCIREIPS
jgi:hypothetical protein